MYFSHPQVVFQEVPGEISLALSISGCNIGCKGCHSAQTWKPNYGEELTESIFLSWVNKYPNMITSILFYGGEWEPEALNKLLIISQENNLKTALYTGLELRDVPKLLLKNLTFIKTGKFIKELGGIDSPRSNQRFFNVQTGEEQTSLFRKNNNIPVTNLNTSGEYNA